MVQVPARIYKAQAQGQVPTEKVASLEGFANVLNKTGGFVSAMGHGAATALGASAVGIGGAMALDKTIDALTLKRDLANVLAVNKHLKSEFSEAEIMLAFKSIRSMNPQFSKDPLVAGHLLGTILRNRDPMNPRLPPRVDTQLAVTLSNAGKNPDGRARMLEDAFSKGYSGGYKTNLGGDGSRGGSGGGSGGGTVP